ncbi:hypothetical protein UA08_06812 [Talaromyces atroroseus]|uniref:Peroxygenase 3 n=1 Tax=Talaromyces atroroseus TaxID=1441469 RepID=A0A225AIH4_TALAT|nr:hypothetical protein UA08_06812 [Talaromyces atroroseus]OKL58044.1 hypothetical protein UA08_06812 [Talaromyces atroroseus]
MAQSTSTLGFDTAVTKSTVTQNRPPAVDADTHLDCPSVARANQAATRENPSGSENYANKYKDYTVLQQHVLFWDRDNDGTITPLDTYIGFRDLGFNIIFSILAVLIINISFSYPTRLAYSWVPDPLFRVYLPSIHKAKHGSDSAVIDNEGRFVPQAFENLFTKYSRNGEEDTLSLADIFRLMKGHRVAADPFGWGAAFFEWGTTWLLIQRNGKVQKEDLRQVYDGSIFWNIREKRRRPEGWNQGYGLGGDGFVGPVKVI